MWLEEYCALDLAACAEQFKQQIGQDHRVVFALDQRLVAAARAEQLRDRGVWIVARLSGYTPAKTPLLESIKETVESQLRQELALKQAKMAGEAKLVALRAKPNAVVEGLSLPQSLSRHNRNG